MISTPIKGTKTTGQPRCRRKIAKAPPCRHCQAETWNGQRVCDDCLPQPETAPKAAKTVIVPRFAQLRTDTSHV